MLKYICNNIINKEQSRDMKDFLSNIVADMYVESITRGNK